MRTLFNSLCIFLAISFVVCMIVAFSIALGDWNDRHGDVPESLIPLPVPQLRIIFEFANAVVGLLVAAILAWAAFLFVKSQDDDTKKPM